MEVTKPHRKVKAKVNFGYLLLMASIGITDLNFANHVKEIDEEMKKVTTYTVADELRDNAPRELFPQTSSTKLVFSEVNPENPIEIVNSSNELSNTVPKINETKEELIDNLIIENNYSGMKLSHEYEDYLKELCHKYAEKYDINYDTLYKSLLTIGYQESRGEWNNNGKESPSNDLGEFQINRIHLEEANKIFGYSETDLLNDRYKNADYATYFLCTIINNNHCHNMEDVFGMYNGWIGWETKPLAINYSASCMNIMNEYFKEYTQSISK